MINTDYQVWLVAAINAIITEMGGDPIYPNENDSMEDFFHAALPWIQANAGAGGGTVLWFNSTTDRDTYFTDNPGKLKDGMSVGVGDPVTVYTYDGINWITGALAFRGPPGITPTIGTNGNWFLGTEDTGVKAQGPVGNGVASLTPAYAVGDDGTTTPTTWQDTMPTVPQGKFLWTRFTFTFDTGAPKVFYTASRQGADGGGTGGIPDVEDPTTDGTFNWVRQAIKTGASIVKGWFPLPASSGFDPNTSQVTTTPTVDNDDFPDTSISWTWTNLIKLIVNKVKGLKAKITALPVFGNIVTHNTSEFATAAQGALADDALPKADVVAPTAVAAPGQAAEALATSQAIAAAANSGSSIGNFWFAKTSGGTPPTPAQAIALLGLTLANGMQINYADFTNPNGTVQVYTSTWNSTAWTDWELTDTIAASAVDVRAIITAQIWGIAQADNFGGVMNYASAKKVWSPFPDTGHSFDPAIFEQNSIGQETLKNLGIAEAKLVQAVQDALDTHFINDFTTAAITALPWFAYSAAKVGVVYKFRAVYNAPGSPQFANSSVPYISGKIWWASSTVYEIQVDQPDDASVYGARVTIATDTVPKWYVNGTFKGWNVNNANVTSITVNQMGGADTQLNDILKQLQNAYITASLTVNVTVDSSVPLNTAVVSDTVYADAAAIEAAFPAAGNNGKRAYCAEGFEYLSNGTAWAVTANRNFRTPAYIGSTAALTVPEFAGTGGITINGPNANTQIAGATNVYSPQLQVNTGSFGSLQVRPNAGVLLWTGASVIGTTIVGTWNTSYKASLMLYQTASLNGAVQVGKGAELYASGAGDIGNGTLEIGGTLTIAGGFSGNIGTLTISSGQIYVAAAAAAKYRALETYQRKVSTAYKAGSASSEQWIKLFDATFTGTYGFADILFAQTDNNNSARQGDTIRIQCQSQDSVTALAIRLWGVIPTGVGFGYVITGSVVSVYMYGAINRWAGVTLLNITNRGTGSSVAMSSDAAVTTMPVGYTVLDSKDHIDTTVPLDTCPAGTVLPTGTKVTVDPKTFVTGTSGNTRAVSTTQNSWKRFYSNSDGSVGITDDTTPLNIRTPAGVITPITLTVPMTITGALQANLKGLVGLLPAQDTGKREGGKPVMVIRKMGNNITMAADTDVTLYTLPGRIHSISGPGFTTTISSYVYTPIGEPMMNGNSLTIVAQASVRTAPNAVNPITIIQAVSNQATTDAAFDITVEYIAA